MSPYQVTTCHLWLIVKTTWSVVAQRSCDTVYTWNTHEIVAVHAEGVEGVWSNNSSGSYGDETVNVQYVQRYIVARSREHCCGGNAALFICVVELYVRCQRYKPVVCCNGNTRMDFICTVVQLKNISCRCQQSKGPPSSCKVFDVDLLQTNMEFIDRFSLKSPVSSFTKIRPVDPTNRRTTDMTKLIGAFLDKCERV